MLITLGVCGSMHTEKQNNAPNYTYDVMNNHQKLMVWVGIVGDNTIIGPYIFNQNVTRCSYYDMINRVVVAHIPTKYGQ